MPMVVRLEEAALGTKQGRSAVVYKSGNSLNIAFCFTCIHFFSIANDSPALFFHLSVRVVVTRTSLPSLLPFLNDQSLTTLRDTKTILHDAPTADSTLTSHHDSRLISFHQHAKTRLSSITLLHRTTHSTLSYNNLQQRLRHLTETPHKCAIMSDLCYNCSICHLQTGACQQDLVQCEICYSWGHQYIFCPRGVANRDPDYRYWGKLDE